MNRTCSMALPALLTLGGPGLWSSAAVAQYVGGGTAYGPAYYYAAGPSDYGSGYYYVPQPVAGPYYDTAPAPYVRSSIVVPGGFRGWSYPAPVVRPVPSPNFGLEPESLPAQTAENIAPAPAAPRLGPTWRAGGWRRPFWRMSRNW